jgi:hypothetical protein
MTRGRKKNLDLPLSRSLEQQRAFRARKAQYIASLEERCYKAEAENDILRREIADLRAIAPPSINPEFVSAPLVDKLTTTANFDTTPPSPLPTSSSLIQLRATSDLMQNLSAASASVTKFQEFAQLQNTPINTFAAVPPPLSRSRDNDTPMATTYSNSAALHPASFINRSSSNAGVLNSPDSPPMSLDEEDLRSPNCCGGLLDCSELFEESDADEPEDPISRTRTSGLRSTSKSYANVSRPVNGKI